MVGFILVSGRITIWRDLAYTCGLMVEYIRENIKMMLKMVMEFIFGMMADNSKDYGQMENNTGSEFI
jgi:hypothetical protein